MGKQKNNEAPIYSEYCKICKLYSECVKDKKCSCIDFKTDVNIKTTIHA